MSVQIHVCLLYALGYDTIPLYFVTQILLATSIGNSFSWLLCPFGIAYHYISFEHFLTFLHYKTLQDFIVYVLPESQNQPFLQGSLVPFIRERYQDPKSVCLLFLLLPECHYFYSHFFLHISLHFLNQKVVQATLRYSIGRILQTNKPFKRSLGGLTLMDHFHHFTVTKRHCHHFIHYLSNGTLLCPLQNHRPSESESGSGNTEFICTLIHKQHIEGLLCAGHDPR